MQILVGWDEPSEAELIALYLNAGDNDAEVTTNLEDFEEKVRSGGKWDVILMPTGTPDIDSAYEMFDRIRKTRPDCPIVGACRQGDVYRVARFMTNGMRSYVIRDDAGDFMFLLQSTLESAVEAVRAEREQVVAERLREEIDSVRKLQQSIIPDDLRSPPGYDVCARYESSQIQVLGGKPVIMAGGDYYDVFMLNDDSVVLLLGDASGHGMKACMSIMTMHTLVRMIRTDQYRDTASFVAEVNRRLCEQETVHEEGGFITLLYGVLRADSHTMEWTSAGHPVPLRQNLDTNEVDALAGSEAGGLPLGITPEAEYDSYTSEVPAHCRLMLYTDGLEEAFPEGKEGTHEEFGVEGIIRTLKKSQKYSLEQALQALFDESSAFTEGAGRHDDTSVVLVERSANG